MDIQEKVAGHMCGFDTVQRGNYFRGESVKKTEVEVRERKLKNGKGAGKDEVTGDMLKGGGDIVMYWIWRLCSIAFKSGVMPKTGYLL